VIVRRPPVESELASVPRTNSSASAPFAGGNELIGIGGKNVRHRFRIAVFARVQIVCGLTCRIAASSVCAWTNAANNGINRKRKHMLSMFNN